MMYSTVLGKDKERTEFLSFKILFGIKPRFSIKPSAYTPGNEVLSHARPFELDVALISRAERLVLRTIHGDTRY